MRFRTTIISTGKTAAGIRVPDAIVDGLGAGKRPPVSVAINGYTYRSTVAVMGGEYWIGVSNDPRTAAGLAGGDELEVDLELDTAPREVVVPAAFQTALDAEPAARATFEKLSYSNKSWHVLQIDGTKNEETRQRRILKSIEALREGRIR